MVDWSAVPPVRSDLPVSLAVVVISFVRGGWPEAGWSDLEIHHLVPVASWEDIVVGENQAYGRRWQCSALLP